MLMLFINTVLTRHTSFVSNHGMERGLVEKSARTGVALVSDRRASCLGVEWCLTLGSKGHPWLCAHHTAMLYGPVWLGGCSLTFWVVILGYLLLRDS